MLETIMSVFNAVWKWAVQFKTFELTMSVVNTACVLIVIAYFLIRGRPNINFAERRNSVKELIGLSLLFGFFSLYAGLNSIHAFGAVVSLRHTGPIVGGFIGGPWVGMFAGMLGAVDRFLQGGVSMHSAVLAVILAGAAAGLYARHWKGKGVVGVAEAAIFTVLYESFASLLTLLLVPDFDKAVAIERSVRLPLVIGNAFGVALFIGCVRILSEERETRRAKEQIESELNVARSIQMSMVPKLFPTFPDVSEFEIFAMLDPAKEVGGDFYNFFFLGDDRFCFMVGDVSGKGVPASLFMAVAKTLLESEARAGRRVSCSEILAHTNNELCRGNNESMFVTVFMGILSVNTGKVVYACGGHSPPYLMARNGSVSALPCKPGLALGAMEDAPFIDQTVTLAPGEALVEYTDGVTEAFSATNVMFEEGRLEKALRGMTEKGVGISAKEVARHVESEVRAFTTGAPQSDDITILVLKYYGGAKGTATVPKQ